jgi:hypothetical protein
MPTKGGRVTEDELRKEAEKEYKKSATHCAGRSDERKMLEITTPPRL